MRFAELQRYVHWLFDSIGNPAGQYTGVLSVLFGYDFIVFVPNDENRVVEGLNLRQTYRDVKRVDFVYDRPNCSVLEMMIGLSLKMNQTFYDPAKPEQGPYWFWFMFNNLGLDKYPNSTFYVGSNKLEVENIVHCFVSRSYGPSGHGGLFPLDGSVEDQTQVEVWNQMHAWVVDKV